MTIRGNRRPNEFDIDYLGEWKTPFWDRDKNNGKMRRFGLEGWTRINRHEFGNSWQDELPRGGRVVGNEIDIVLDVEAIHEGDLEKTGAIEYYRSSEDRAKASGRPSGCAGSGRLDRSLDRSLAPGLGLNRFARRAPRLRRRARLPRAVDRRHLPDRRAAATRATSAGTSSSRRAASSSPAAARRG